MYSGLKNSSRFQTGTGDQLGDSPDFRGGTGREESDDDEFLNANFSDPFKYMKAKPKDAIAGGSPIKFRAYQEGENLARDEPAVTFGGGKRPKPEEEPIVDKDK